MKKFYWITPQAKILDVPKEHFSYILQHKDKFKDINFSKYSDPETLKYRAVNAGYIRLGIMDTLAYMQYSEEKAPTKSIKIAINLIVNSSNIKEVSINNVKYDRTMNIDEFWKYYAGLIENKQFRLKPVYLYVSASEILYMKN